MDELSRRQINELDEQLTAARHTLQRVSDDVMALRLLTEVLLRSHPDPAALKMAIETEREKFFAAALSKSVPDRLIERVNEVIAQALDVSESNAGRRSG